MDFIARKIDGKLYVSIDQVNKAIEEKNESEADKVIAEKDAEIAELKKKLMPCLNGDCILTCEVVEKYGKENAELKQKLEDVNELVRTARQMLEDAKASHYAEMVDAGMRERRLRRAFWIARALRASNIQRWWISATCSPITERACRIWNNVERKCRAKAEQYK